MRFICCDLENTSWEDDVDPRHFITVRQAPPAADPKLALQSLLSLFQTCARTSMQVPLLSAHTRAEVCESARSLSHSLFITLPPVHPSITHTHAQNYRWILMKSILFGCPSASGKGVNNMLSTWWAVYFMTSWKFLCLTLEKPLCDIH